MEIVLAATAGGFALVLLAAAATKVDGWASWQAALTNLEIGSARQRRVVRVATPAAEAGIATLLVLKPTWGFLGTAALLGGFSVVVFMISSAKSGQPCRCFGALVESEIGKPLAIRNAVLAAFAACCAYLAWISHAPPLAAGDILIVVLVGFLCLLLLELRKFRHVLDARLEEVEVP